MNTGLSTMGLAVCMGPGSGFASPGRDDAAGVSDYRLVHRVRISDPYRMARAVP